jgi:hypothetical protein
MEASNPPPKATQPVRNGWKGVNTLQIDTPLLWEVTLNKFSDGNYYVGALKKNHSQFFHAIEQQLEAQSHLTVIEDTVALSVTQ